MTDFALHLVVEDVPAAVNFYERALGARVTRLLHLPDRSIATAELAIEGFPLALAAPLPGTLLATPRSTGTSVAAFRFAVADADAAMDRALSAGATVFSPVQDAFWGVRTGEVLDPSGHRWAFDQRLRDVPVEEIEAQLAVQGCLTERLGHSKRIYSGRRSWISPTSASARNEPRSSRAFRRRAECGQAPAAGSVQTRSAR